MLIKECIEFIDLESLGNFLTAIFDCSALLQLVLETHGIVGEIIYSPRRSCFGGKCPDSWANEWCSAVYRSRSKSDYNSWTGSSRPAKCCWWWWPSQEHQQQRRRVSHYKSYNYFATTHPTCGETCTKVWIRNYCQGSGPACGHVMLPVWSPSRCNTN